MIRFKAFGIASRQVLGVYEDHVLVMEYHKPDPNGPLMYMVDDDKEPQWMVRIVKQSKAPDLPHDDDCNCDLCIGRLGE